MKNTTKWEACQSLFSQFCRKTFIFGFIHRRAGACPRRVCPHRPSRMIRTPPPSGGWCSHLAQSSHRCASPCRAGACSRRSFRQPPPPRFIPPSGSIVALLTAVRIASFASLLHPSLIRHWRGRGSGATGGASAAEPAIGGGWSSASLWRVIRLPLEGGAARRRRWEVIRFPLEGHSPPSGGRCRPQAAVGGHPPPSGGSSARLWKLRYPDPASGSFASPRLLLILRSVGANCVRPLRCSALSLRLSAPGFTLRSGGAPIWLNRRTGALRPVGRGLAPAARFASLLRLASSLHLAQSSHCSLPFALLVSPASSTPPLSATGGVGVPEPLAALRLRSPLSAVGGHPPPPPCRQPVRLTNLHDKKTPFIILSNFNQSLIDSRVEHLYNTNDRAPAA